MKIYCETHNFALKAKPDLIIILGPLPTCKTLRKWIENTSTKRIVIEPRGIKVDPLSGNSTEYQILYEQFSEIDIPSAEQGWLDYWQSAEEKINTKVMKAFAKQHTLFERVSLLIYYLFIYLTAPVFSLQIVCRSVI